MADLSGLWEQLGATTPRACDFCWFKLEAKPIIEAWLVEHDGAKDAEIARLKVEVAKWQILAGGAQALLGQEGDDHYVTFKPDGWFIEHSLECRLSGEMAKGCKWQAAVLEIASPDCDLGRWHIDEIDSEGLPSLTHAPVMEEQ